MLSKTCARCGIGFNFNPNDNSKGVYCSRACSNTRFGTVVDRFFRSFIVDASGCWIWQANKGRRGYGLMKDRGVRHIAHRFSYQYHHGPIPDGHVVLHSCDVPSCVNPDHLSTGTQLDNVRDSVQKGRRYSALTDSDVRFIRTCGMSLSNISARFGIGTGYASRVRASKARISA